MIFWLVGGESFPGCETFFEFFGLSMFWMDSAGLLLCAGRLKIPYNQF
jgi:hypothetical protein